MIESVRESATIRSKVNSLVVTQPDYQSLQKLLFIFLDTLIKWNMIIFNAATLLHLINDDINKSSIQNWPINVCSR